MSSLRARFRGASVSLFVTGIACAALSHAARAQAPQNYIALGDSYAYGYTSQATTPAGLGDMGYVSLFANYLATRNNNVRPSLTSLATPGETTQSLRSGPPASAYNLNYTGTGNQSQIAVYEQRAAAIALAASRVDYVTLQVGGNDLLNLFVSTQFQAADLATRETLINDRLALVQTNYDNILSRVRAAAPQARIFLLGYPDPFAGLNPNPLAGYSTRITQRENALFQSLAPTYGATYVDIFTPFVGNETAYTNIQSQDPAGSGFPNFHPNAQGYSVIAGRLQAAVAVPEPSALALALPLLPFALLMRRRKKF